MKIGRKTLEGYLVVVIAVIAVTVYLSLEGMAAGISAGTLYLGILLLILIAVEILIAILLLRLVDKNVVVGEEALKKMLERED